MKFVLALVAALTATSALAETRTLELVHTHTGESVAVAYKQDGAFIPEGVAALNRFLRDHRNGKTKALDPELFDILYEIRVRVGSEDPYHLISAYRSPETNEMLRRASSGVAKNSMHTHGRAIDVRLPGVETERLRDIALEMERGGVGFYQSSDFIHVDTGRVRRW